MRLQHTEMASRRAMMFAEYFQRRINILESMHLIFQINDADPMSDRLRKDHDDMELERAHFFSDTPLLDLLSAYRNFAINTNNTPWPAFMLHGIEEFYLQPIHDLVSQHSTDYEYMRIRLLQLDDFLAFFQQHGNLAAFPIDHMQRLRDALQQRLDTVMQDRTDALFMATHNRLGEHAPIHQIGTDLLKHIHDQTF